MALPRIRSRVDQIVEGALHVEHHGREAASLTDVQLRQGRLGNGLGLVAESADPERVGQPPGGVDREHERAPAAARGFDAQSGGDRGLAHAAAAHADRDPAPLEGALGELPRAHAATAAGGLTKARARAVISSGPSTPPTR
jgi:hypothetical protein